MPRLELMPDCKRAYHAINVVLDHEKGLVDHPNDPGGITNWGISLRSYPHLGSDGIRNLTKEQATEIYYKDWWIRYKYNQIENLTIATKILDIAVNIGPVNANRILQRAVNFLADDVLKVDGVLGPKTFAAVKSCRADKLHKVLQFKIAEYYHALAKARQSARVFLMGWLNRAYS